MSDQIRFCAYCGSALHRDLPGSAGRDFNKCRDCGRTTTLSSLSDVNRGPALLVLVLIFAADRILLLKRGLQPYREKWAPPGGFVERNESLETAAAREVWEEVRIELDRTQLVPHAVTSLPRLNQVYHIFKAHLSKPVAASAVLPESLEVGWFSECDLSKLDLWAPALNVDMAMQFDGVRNRRFDFFQSTDGFSRVITEGGQIKYQRHEPASASEARSLKPATRPMSKRERSA